jgi:hypothetical protein
VVNGALPKITGQTWPSQAKNFLLLPCGRSRTNISTLLTPIKTGGLEPSVVLLFEFAFFYSILRAYFVFFFFTLLYISKFVLTLISL